MMGTTLMSVLAAVYDGRREVLTAVIQQPAAGLDHEVGHPRRDTIEAVTDACKQQHKSEPLQVAQRQIAQPRIVTERE